MVPKDPRLFVNGTQFDRDKSWRILKETQPEILKIYQLVVTRLLSRNTGISLDNLFRILIWY